MLRTLAALQLSVVLVAGTAAPTEAIQQPTKSEGQTQFVPASAWKLKGHGRFKKTSDPVVIGGPPEPGVGGLYACEAIRALPKDVPRQRYEAEAKGRHFVAFAAQHNAELATAKEAASLVRRMKGKTRQTCLNADRKEWPQSEVLSAMCGSFDGGTYPKSSVVVWGSAIKDGGGGGCGGYLADGGQIEPANGGACAPITDRETLVAVGRINNVVTVLVLQVFEKFDDAQWRALLDTTRRALAIQSAKFSVPL